MGKVVGKVANPRIGKFPTKYGGEADLREEV